MTALCKYTIDSVPKVGHLDGSVSAFCEIACYLPKCQGIKAIIS